MAKASLIEDKNNPSLASSVSPSNGSSGRSLHSKKKKKASIFSNKLNNTEKITSTSSTKKQGAELILLDPLNYEDEVQRRGFSFIIQVTDKVSRIFIRKG